MHYALYRKYRPVTFDEVVGQEHITTVLKGEVSSGRVAHSYLFTGSRGTGKTSCAKILAKAVNCLSPENGNPCGVCESCKGVDNGTLLDVVEMDAASNSRVEDVRDIIEQAVYTPAVAKYRVYIIDEVHMLSNNAFNALLKIMEEPPAHVLFILATTEIHKVLPTIISRCQRFDFRRIAPEIITERLLFVCEQENIPITREGGVTIALLAEGGMRDALSLLEVCSSKGVEITPEVVNSSAGIIGYDRLIALADMLMEGDVLSLLKNLEEMLGTTTEPSGLCDSLLRHYRNLLLAKTIEDPSELLTCLPSYLPTLKAQCKKLSLPSILESLGVLMQVKSVIGRSTTKRLELEIGLIKLTRIPREGAGEGFLERIEALEHRLEALVKEGVPTRAQKPQRVSASSEESGVPAQETASAASSAATPTAAPKPATKPTVVAPFPEWNKVLLALQKINSAIGSMLTGCEAYSDGRRVLIDVQNPILLQMLKDNETTRNTIKRAIIEVTGVNYGIGPYRKENTVVSSDPFESFLSALPQSDEIKIEG